jgi:ribonuclease BN (tRNA processing enzyme)
VGLSLTVLGCSGSYPGPGEACSGYLVRGAGTTLWMDAGSGTMSNLQRHVSLSEVDGVVLSHEHPDHWQDIEGFFVAMKYGEQARQGIPVLSPPGVRKKTSRRMHPTFAWRDVHSGDTAVVGGLSLRFSSTDHGPETLAVRIDGDGKSLGYSSDTGPDWRLSSLGTGLDLVVCEASYTGDSSKVPGHLTARQAAAAAAAAEAKQLLLTHFWPTIDREQSAREAGALFDGPVHIATTNEEYHL